MEIIILTIFPDFAASVFRYGIVGRAIESGIIAARSIDIRGFTDDVHRTVDDVPFGGGPGMVMLPEPIWRAVESLADADGGRPYLICTSPAGEPFTQKVADELAAYDRLAILCGRYEGVDRRVVDHLVDREVSLGDFILSGGEIAAMAIADAVVRRIPGALGNDESHRLESFADDLLEYPQYTRPESYRGHSVPDVLLTGDHAAIERFRRMEAMRVTRERRPDLWTKFCKRYSGEDRD